MQRNTTQQVLYSKSRCPLFPVTTFRSSDRDPNSIDIRIQVRIFKSRFRLTFSSDPTLSHPPPFFLKKSFSFRFLSTGLGGEGEWGATRRYNISTLRRKELWINLPYLLPQKGGKNREIHRVSWVC